jgi:hypothetical protein
MKIVSILVFLAALIGSWHAVYGKKAVPESVHVGIQNDLKKVITEYVEKNLPQAQNLRFEKMWTETVKSDRVKANFIYTYEDKREGDSEPALIEVSGAALLNKVSETPEMTTWNFDELRILDNTVNFTEPVQITAGTGEIEGGAPPAGDGTGEGSH